MLHRNPQTRGCSTLVPLHVSKRKGLFQATRKDAACLRDCRKLQSTYCRGLSHVSPEMNPVTYGTDFAANRAAGASGTGIKDIVRKVTSLVKNKLGKNPDKRPGFPGERHVPLPTSHGVTIANFAGPGTQIAQRLKRGDKGVDGPRGIDEIAKLHDIDYVNAQKESDIRRADNLMIDRVRNSSAGRLTKKIVIAALKAKKFGEDHKITDVNTFTDSVPEEGLGKGWSERKKKDPAQKLLQRTFLQERNRKTKLLREFNRKRKKRRKTTPSSTSSASASGNSSSSATKCSLMQFPDGSYRPRSHRTELPPPERRTVKRRRKK